MEALYSDRQFFNDGFWDSFFRPLSSMYCDEKDHPNKFYAAGFRAGKDFKMKRASWSMEICDEAWMNLLTNLLT